MSDDIERVRLSALSERQRKCLSGEHEPMDCGIIQEVEGLSGLVYACKHCRCIFVEKP